MWSGSTKNLKITSGGASILTSRSTGIDSSLTATTPPSTLDTLPAVVGFGRRLESRQSLAPELVEELAQLGETFGADAVQAPGAVAALIEQSGVLEDAEVLRDRGTGDVEVRRDRARAQLVVADEMQDVTASGLGQCPRCFQCVLRKLMLTKPVKRQT